jgi:hypothetical protein
MVVGYLVANPHWGPLPVDLDAGDVHDVAEVTLALVLVSDASRVNAATLRHDLSLPLRLRGVGLPHTLLLGAGGGSIGACTSRLISVSASGCAVRITAIRYRRNAATSRSVSSSDSHAQVTMLGLANAARRRDGRGTLATRAEHRRKRRMSNYDTFMAFAGTYPDVAAAEGDYQAVKDRTTAWI